MIDVNDIPKELLDKIRKMFDENQKVVMLRVRQRDYQEKGMFIEALKIAKELDALYHETVTTYIESVKDEVEQMDVESIGMNEADTDKFTTLTLVMFMACDIIDSATMDINSTIRKYVDEDYEFDMFDDIRELAKAAKSKIEYLQHNSDFMKDLVWGDKCDNMYDMLQNKAKSILHKKKNDKNYGRNAEKFK